MSDTTKEAILDAAFAEFSEKGKAGGRMQAIADRAGINKAMLNYYFTSKDDLYGAVIERGIQNLHIVVLERIDFSQSIEAIVLDLVERYIRYWSANVPLLRLIFHDLLEDGRGMRQAIQNVASAEERTTLITALRNSGKLRETDPRQLIFHLTGLTLLFHIQQAILPPEFLAASNSEDIIETRIRSVQDLLLHGLFTNPSSELTEKQTQQ